MTFSSTLLRNSSSARRRSPSRMVYCSARVHLLVSLVEALDGLFQDGLYPRPPLVPEKMRVSSRLTPGAVDEGVGDVLQEAAH